MIGHETKGMADPSMFFDDIGEDSGKPTPIWIVEEDICPRIPPRRDVVDSAGSRRWTYAAIPVGHLSNPLCLFPPKTKTGGMGSGSFCALWRWLARQNGAREGFP